MENIINLDLVSNYPILKELSSHQQIKNVEFCEDHDDTAKLFYDLNEKKFICGFCLIHHKNLDSFGFVDIKKFISKNHLNLLSGMSQELMKNSKKIADSVKILLENLQEKKKTLTIIYEDLINEAKKNYEATLAKIDKIIQSLHYDDLYTKCESNLLEIQLNDNKLNLDAILFKISEIHESIYLLNEFNQIDNKIEKNKLEINRINYLSRNLKNEMIKFYELSSSESSREIMNLNCLPPFNLKQENILSSHDGIICMDSSNYCKNENIYVFDGFNNSIIKIYENYNNLANDRYDRSQKVYLKFDICGTYNIVFNNYIYARKGPHDSSKTFIKICLNTSGIKAENRINDFNNNSASPWGYRNDHFFLTNGKELFLIYNKNDKSLGLCKICPETLRIIQNFNFEVKPEILDVYL